MSGDAPRRARLREPAASAVFTTEDGSERGVNVGVLRGSPTPEEIAAVTAVLSAALVEEVSRADTVPSDGTSAWQRSQRTLRTPLVAGPGHWRNFSA